jgi:hypothetical protein
VRALLVSMALIWTKLAEEAEPIQRTKLGVANDDTAGQTQVPRGSASDAMPTLQDTDESAQVAASSLTWTTAATNAEQKSCEPCHAGAKAHCVWKLFATGCIFTPSRS